MLSPCISLNRGCKLKNTTITLLPHSCPWGRLMSFRGLHAVIMFTFGFWVDR